MKLIVAIIIFIGFYLSAPGLDNKMTGMVLTGLAVGFMIMSVKIRNSAR